MSKIPKTSFQKPGNGGNTPPQVWPSRKESHLRSKEEQQRTGEGDVQKENGESQRKISVYSLEVPQGFPPFA